jgi:hypothetical protein
MNSTEDMKPARLGTGARLFPPHTAKSSSQAVHAMMRKDVGDDRFEKRTDEVIRAPDLSSNNLTFNFHAPNYVLFDLSNLWLDLGLRLIDEDKTDNVKKVDDGAKMCPITNILHSVISYVGVRDYYCTR